MGHIESYQFIDPREGNDGICYAKRTLAEAQAEAEKLGYSGNITKVVIAYPPAPPSRIRGEGCEWQDIDDDLDGVIPF